MKKILCLLFFMTLPHTQFAINPMAAAMEAEAKKHETAKKSKAPKKEKAPAKKKSNTTHKKEKSPKAKHSTDTTHKTTKPKKSSTDLPKYIVTIKNNSTNKAAKVSGISILYLPANSKKTVPISTSKTFTIPAKSISTVSLGLQLGTGESYAGASELIVGSNNDKIAINSNDWSKDSTDKNKTSGGGWISGVTGYPPAIYITFQDNKWILDLDAMKSDGKESKTSAKAAHSTKAQTITKGKKTTSHTVVATHKDHIKTKLHRKAKKAKEHSSKKK